MITRDFMVKGVAKLAILGETFVFHFRYCLWAPVINFSEREKFLLDIRCLGIVGVMSFLPTSFIKIDFEI